MFIHTRGSVYRMIYISDGSRMWEGGGGGGGGVAVRL